MKHILTALMMSLIISTSVSAQTLGPLSGTVMDSSGEPLIGAGVIVKGTTNGAATDYEGKYSLKISSSRPLWSCLVSDTRIWKFRLWEKNVYLSTSHYKMPKTCWMK